MTPPYPLVALSWSDAHSPDATQIVDATNLADIHGTLLIRTVGWELRADEHGVTLANEFCGDTEFRGTTFVPRSLVVERIELAPRRAPQRRQQRRQRRHVGEDCAPEPVQRPRE